MLYFDGVDVKKEFVRLARVHRQGRAGALVDSIRSWRMRHPATPDLLDGPPAHKLRCRIPKTAADLRAELADFDTWIGGAAVRPRVISILLAEYCQRASTIELGGTVLALAQGVVEVYAAPRRRPAA